MSARGTRFGRAGRDWRTVAERAVGGDRMDVMLAYFQTCMSPEYKEMATRINDRGGIQAVMDNERLLKELVDARGVSESTAEVRGAHGHRREVAFDMEELRAELKEDVEMAMEKNSHTFSRKFEMQRKQIVDELTKAIHREGDRVIDAVTAGPHDRIIDPVSLSPMTTYGGIHSRIISRTYMQYGKKWCVVCTFDGHGTVPITFQGWRGSTKARHFVLALRDYFREKMEEKKRTNNFEVSRINEQDEWALEWINVTRLQPIVEAFDDDASNFITVTEANDLTTARPRDWRRALYTLGDIIIFNNRLACSTGSPIGQSVSSPVPHSVRLWSDMCFRVADIRNDIPRQDQSSIRQDVLAQVAHSSSRTQLCRYISSYCLGWYLGVNLVPGTILPSGGTSGEVPELY